MRLTLLGCGSSAGTPVIGCDCKTCTSPDLRNRRMRSSAVVVTPEGKTLLIDTGPDLYHQSLRENLRRVDAVLYTHTHADHVHGIDDLRSFCQLQRQQIPLYGNAETMQIIAARFGYTLQEPSGYWDMPILSLNPVTGPFEAGGVSVIPIPLQHGGSNILGYRIGNIAYLTDVSAIPASSLELLHGLEVLLLDCLRYRAHHTHINLEQSLQYAGLIKARNTYLIHMTHEMEYGELSSRLPQGVHVAFDGLQLNDEIQIA